MLIFQVVEELSSLGLTASTLHLLVAGDKGASQLESNLNTPVHVQYEFEGSNKTYSTSANIFS